MKIKALVMDMDGTLYDQEGVKRVTAATISRTKEYLRRKDMASRLPRAVIEETIDAIDRSGQTSRYIHAISKRFGVGYRRFDDYVNKDDPRKLGIKRDERLIALLLSLSKRYRIVVFTNSPDIWAGKVIRALGIGHIVGRNMVTNNMMKGYLKPSPQAFNTMLRLTRLKKNEIIFMDDNIDNVNAARALGIRSIRVVNNGRSSRNSIYSILKRMQYKGRDGNR